jgi:hypothetical protein
MCGLLLSVALLAGVTHARTVGLAEARISTKPFALVGSAAAVTEAPLLSEAPPPAERVHVHAKKRTRHGKWRAPSAKLASAGVAALPGHVEWMCRLVCAV